MANILWITRALFISCALLCLGITAGAAQNTAPYEVIDYPTGPVAGIQHTTLLKLTRSGRPTLEIGYGDVKQGVRLPSEGSVSLPVDDIGVMIQGRQIANVAGGDVEVNARQLVHVFPGIAQSAAYVEPTKLLFLFFGDTVEDPAVPNPKEAVDNNPSLTVWTAAELAQRPQDAPAVSRTLLKADGMENPILQIGIARISAGARTPETGDAAVQAHNVEVILKGKAVATINGEDILLQAGDIIRIPPGARHSARFLEDTEIAYIFYGADVSQHLVNAE